MALSGKVDTLFGGYADVEGVCATCGAPLYDADIKYTNSGLKTPLVEMFYSCILCGKEGVLAYRITTKDWPIPHTVFDFLKNTVY